MRDLFRLALLVWGVALVGCASPTGPSKPVETKPWVVVDGHYQFYTNDQEYFGYSFWNPFMNEIDPNAVFSTMKGVAKKVSGAKNQGFGFLFCYSDRDNYYEVMITTTGYLTIWKQVAGAWSQIWVWQSVAALAQGFNVENTIEVTRSAGAVFAVTINGELIGSFTDTSLNKDGFATFATVGTATNESFPETPEDIRFRFTSPVTKPHGSMATYSDLPTASRR